MKKLIIGAYLLLIGIAGKAQGFEGLIVEKYYVSNANDATGSSTNGGGTLPAGSITWRFYADLLPGYKLQAVYGVDAAPTGAPGTISAGDHRLLLQTTTSFFNNEDRGATTPTYTKAQTALNSVMLDSWVSVGAACNGYFGIQKTSDNGVSNTTNSNGMLQNNIPAIGVPLTTQDGLIAGSPEAVTFVGVNNPGDLTMFDATSQAGNLFSTYNGSWASLNGSTGPDANNRVLIAQITTDGVLTYNFNLQIGTPSNGVERYVASNAVGAEIVNSTLSGVLNQPNICPTVSITAPTNGASYFVSDAVTINATAADADGTITQVEFFVNGVSVGVDNATPFTANYTATLGTKNLTAVATDNVGCTTTSSTVTITVGSNTAPTVSVTAPTTGAIVVEGATVTINATAADADGTVAQVQFYVDGNLIGSDNSSPYTFNWTSVIGNHTITAKATDNNGAITTSAAVAVTVISSSQAYTVVSSSNPCDANAFCVPVSAVIAVDNVKGYDVELNYDKTKVTPTGVITVQSNLVNPGYVSTANNIDGVNGKIYLSLYFNSSAPANSEFNGTGNVFCVEFVKTAGFLATDTAVFSIPTLQESYISGVQTKLVGNGRVTTSQNTTFTSSLNFWTNNSPLAYDGTGTTTLSTSIYGSASNCTGLSSTFVRPDTAGNFTYDLTNGAAINIQRDIAEATSVQPVVNGFDAFLARRVIINDATLTPSAYQMVALDVNLDGVISAGDLSQINQRAVLILGEFQQAWNYLPNGTSMGPKSKDWVFLPQSVLNTAAYQLSSAYPGDDGVGISKARVPVTAFCHTVPVFTNLSTGCSSVDAEVYTGVLLGDVNGNFATVGSGGTFKTNNGNVVLNLSKAVYANGFIDVPVEVASNQNINAVDFAVKFDESKLTFQSIISPDANISVLENFNTADRTFRVTSNSLSAVDMSLPLFSVRFAANTTQLTAADFNSTEAYLNGDPANFEFAATALSIGNNTNDVAVSVYPNPAINVLMVKVSEKATIQLFDISGQQVLAQVTTNANEQQQINTENIASGVYMLKVYNNHFATTKRVVVTK